MAGMSSTVLPSVAREQRRQSTIGMQTTQPTQQSNFYCGDRNGQGDRGTQRDGDEHSSTPVMVDKHE